MKYRKADGQSASGDASSKDDDAYMVVRRDEVQKFLQILKSYADSCDQAKRDVTEACQRNREVGKRCEEAVERSTKAMKKCEELSKLCGDE